MLDSAEAVVDGVAPADEEAAAVDEEHDEEATAVDEEATAVDEEATVVDEEATAVDEVDEEAAFLRRLHSRWFQALSALRNRAWSPLKRGSARSGCGSFASSAVSTMKA